MREARSNRRRASVNAAGTAGIVAAVGLRLWTKAAQHPVDSAAILTAGAASIIIIVNAVFLQSGPHPAPFFANPAAQLRPAESRSDVPIVPARSPEAAARPAAGLRTPQPASARRNDPIGDLIGSSVGSPARIVAVQRVLSEFGYGQIRASGVLDEPTSAAIGRFESEHKMPVTGRLSDRLLSELATLAGHPIE